MNNKPILVGSRALMFWFPTSFSCRADSDWDFIAETTYGLDFLSKVDTSSFSDLNNRAVAEEYRVDMPNLPYDIMGLTGLSIMKRSHLHRDHFFEKHINQYHSYLKLYCLPLDYPLLKERIKLTKEAYPQSNPKLNQTNEDFFDDAVKKVYDHDYIHELYAYYDRPIFERLKDDQSLAWCEKDKWNSLSYDDKIKCVCEEAYVIATERFMIPKGWNFPSKRAYLEAVHKICTTLTSGWFRDFAIDNYPTILDMYDKSKFEKVKGILNESS